MSRIGLKVQGVSDLTALENTSLLIVTDLNETRQVTMLCDRIERHEFGIRRGKFVGSEEQKKRVAEELQMRLPETLISIVKYLTSLQLCVVITSVYKGKYVAVLEDTITGTAVPINALDGVLLSYADIHIPLYIEESLWKRQSVPFRGDNASGVAIPLNTLSVSMLHAAMEKCIEDEQYEMAQQLKEELKRRETK